MRYEFSRKQREEIRDRAGGCCESCHMPLKPGEGEYDHVIAQAIGGENTVDNAQLLCGLCHRAKSAVDTGLAAKVKRVQAKHNGTFPPSPTPLRSRNTFPRRFELMRAGNPDDPE